ncbi:MAG: ABC transporter permease, partial [Kofleriaceae bacterium]|nr:ABC transporter permease [Kofleriaceae bacterium]
MGRSLFVAPGVSVVSAALRALSVALLVTLVSWTLVECAPGTSAERAAIAARAIVPGDLDMPKSVRDSIVTQIGEKHGLHSSFPARLAKQSLGLLRLDFGSSWRDERTVRGIVFSRAGLLSLVICLLSLALGAIAGTFVALATAKRPESAGHRSFSVLAALVLSLPLPWLAMVLASSFSYGSPFSFMPLGGGSASSLILPLLVMAAVPAVVIWRHLHKELARQSGAAWVLSAKARGVGESMLWSKHILRASVPNLLSLLPVLLAYLFGAILLVERVFAIEGLGETISRAAAAGDAPVL